MHVARVESNIKGGVDVELGELSLVVGPSASCKTSIWNALELTFLGGCSDVGVYDWRAKDVDLLDALSPPEATKLWTRVTMDDGQVCMTEIVRNKKTGGAKKATRKVPVEADLPVHPFRAGLRGSTSAIRSFLLTRMTDSVTEKDVVDRIQPDQRDAFKKVLSAVRGAEDRPVDLLLSVLGAAKDRANKAKKVLLAYVVKAKAYTAKYEDDAKVNAGFGDEQMLNRAINAWKEAQNYASNTGASRQAEAAGKEIEDLEARRAP